MTTRVMKVVSQTEVAYVPSTKSDTGQMAMSTVCLTSNRDFTIVGTMFGNLATCRFQPGQLVHATFRLSVREHEGRLYQDVVIVDVQPITPVLP